MESWVGEGARTQELKPIAEVSTPELASWTSSENLMGNGAMAN